MPEERFRKDIGNKKFGIEVIDYLRAEYKISRTACALRFADIGNYPLLIVYAENNIIRWSYSSEDFPFKWMINDKIVPRNTVMGDYFRFLSVRLNRLKNKLLANYLRNRGNDLATVRNSAFCVAILSNNSFICKYDIFFRKYEL